MFARFLELTLKPEKKNEYIKCVRTEVLPILKKYPGFFDLTVLELEAEPNKVFSISFWTEKADALKYDREFFPKVKQLTEPFLAMPPVVKFCLIENTLTEKFLKMAA